MEQVIDTDKIIDGLLSDLSAYNEYIRDMLKRDLVRHPFNALEWHKWFEYKEGKDLIVTSDELKKYIIK